MVRVLRSLFHVVQLLLRLRFLCLVQVSQPIEQHVFVVNELLHLDEHHLVEFERVSVPLT